MAQKVDLISQYIASVLIPRLNRANALYSQGRYVNAVDTQVQVIKTLFRDTPEEKTKLKNWVKRFDTIMKKADAEKGRTEALETWKKINKMNALARLLYDDLEWEIWNYLHELGYFKQNKSYGLSMEQLEKIEPQDE